MACMPNMNHIVLNDSSLLCSICLSYLEVYFFMNKATLIAKMAEKSELSRKQAEAAVNAFTDVITEALKAANQMEWVQRRNSVHNRAEEVILTELVYD